MPGSSVDFTTVYQQIELFEAKVGDLILFTGTDSTIRVVGHMGIVSSDPGKKIELIHSTHPARHPALPCPLLMPITKVDLRRLCGFLNKIILSSTANYYLRFDVDF